MSADPVTPATGNERDAAMIREQLSQGQRDSQLLDGREFNEAPWDAAHAALDRLVAALSAAGEDARKRDEWECQIAAMNSELATKLDAAEAALSAATTERDEALAQVGAATTILAEAEKIVPGIITTAGRFAIGLNDRERAVAAERALDQTREAIASALTSLGTGPPKDGYAYAVLDAVLAAAAPATTPNEPEGAHDA